MLTADVALWQSLALCADVKTIELADIMVKAWALALRATPSADTTIALAIAQGRSIISGAAAKSLTAIAAARRDGAADAQDATSAVTISGAAGIISIADVLRPPHTTMLGIGAPRRAPVEAADGSIRFADTVTATLVCDPRAVDAAQGAALLAAFKGFVERPVMMIV